MTFDFGFRGITRLCSGLWSYLAAKVNGRAAVALERERNLGTVEVIRALPQGAQVVVYEPNGGLRVIQMPGSEHQAPITHMTQIQLPAIEPPVTSPQFVTDPVDPVSGEPSA